MGAFIKQLELISLVDQNFSHIQQLESLLENYKLMKESNYSKEYPNIHLLTQEEINKLIVITETTRKSHYESELLNSNNHILNVLKEYNSKPVENFKTKYYESN